MSEKVNKKRRKLEKPVHQADDFASEYGCTYREHFQSLENVLRKYCGENSELTAEEAYARIFNFDEDPNIAEEERTCFVQSSNKEPPRLFAEGQSILEKPAGPRTNKPNPIILASRADSEGYAITHRFVLFRNDWKTKLKKAQEYPFAVIAPIAYFGGRNLLARSGMFYALQIDLDGIDAKRLEAFLVTAMTYDYVYPLPNMIVLSGNNIHVLYLMEKPLNMTQKMRDWLRWTKIQMVTLLWNKYLSSIPNPQFGSINQSYRLINAPSGKIDGISTKCFLVNDKSKWSIFGNGIYCFSRYFSEYTEKEALKHMQKPPLPEIAGVDDYGKPRVTWEQAKELWPEWAKEVEMAKEEGRSRQIKGFKVNRNLYDFWKRQIVINPYVGIRYFRVWSLSVIGAKCSVDFKELKKDAEELQIYFNTVGGEEFPFTVGDMEDALKGYTDERSNRYTFRLLCNYAGITYTPKPKKPTPYKDAYYLQKEMEALRNGTIYEKEKFSREESFRMFAMEKGHILLARARATNPDFYKNTGRKSFISKVEEWHKNNPYGTPKKCATETGIANKTAGKYYKELGYPERSEDIVRKFRKENPDATIKDCMKASGLSRASVYVYWESVNTIAENTATE